MSTIEELQQACAEFSQNFAALSTKHDALGKELEAEKSHRRKLEGQLAAAAEEVQQYAEAVKAQRASTEEALQYKERYYATCVAVEHLKGRLEVAKKALAEKDEEHEAEKEHLHAQMNDLLSRIDANSSDKQVKTLKERIVQLEEQCALLSGNTIEEKERMMQQQILSNSTVRDLQSKVANSEQRLRAAESEVSQLRAMLRRSSEVKNEIEAANDRLESEKSRLVLSLEEKSRELQSVQRSATEAQRVAEEKAIATARAHEKVVKQLRAEVSTLRESLDKKTEDLARESEKLGEFRAALTKKMNTVRDECHKEIEILQTSKNEALAEVQRLKWRATQEATHSEELTANAMLLQQRIDYLERQQHELSAQIEAAAQKENFVVAEREQLKQTIATMQLRLTESQQHQTEKEAATASADRLRLQLAYTESELFETRKQLSDMAHKAKTIEIECEKKIKFMHKQLRSQMKKREDEMHKNEDLRRRLVAETIYGPSSSPASSGGKTFAGQTVAAPYVPAAAPMGSLDSAAGAACGVASVDVLEVLKQQSSQATLLQERLSALAR